MSLSYVKGAVEIILDPLRVQILKGSKANPLQLTTKTEKEKILKTNEEMASQALRVLGYSLQRIARQLEPKNMIIGRKHRK